MPIDDRALAAFHALQTSRPGRKPKLSFMQQRETLQRLAAGELQRSIARDFRVSRCNRSGRPCCSSSSQSPGLPWRQRLPSTGRSWTGSATSLLLFLENRSFDHLYGLFPGAEGIQDSGFASIQLSAEGLQFATLPAVINNLARLGGIDFSLRRRSAERTIPCGPIY